MTTEVAYYNGRFVPLTEVGVPPWDAGFVLGTTVSEQLRTFRGQLFQLDQHLERLLHSLAIIGVPCPQPQAELAAVANKLVQRNRALVSADDDLGLSLWVTPGDYPTLAPVAAAGPRWCLHTYPLPFKLWADNYSTGVRLVVSQITQTPATCWPADLKCRSRMHYFLADQAARAQDPFARALLCDVEGNVCETSVANVVACYGQDLVTPPTSAVLPGISLAYVRGLAHDLGMTWQERPLSPRALHSADEILLTSTPSCLLPVLALDGQPVGAGSPGPVFAKLLAAWSDQVRCDIAAQARRFAKRRA